MGVNIEYKLSKTSRLVYVKYLDHVEFRNTNSSLFQPSIREVVGWIARETDQALWVLSDRSINPLPFETRESGLIILKINILERGIIA